MEDMVAQAQVLGITPELVPVLGLEPWEVESPAPHMFNEQQWPQYEVTAVDTLVSGRSEPGAHSGHSSSDIQLL